jgi:hypothetical protein
MSQTLLFTLGGLILAWILGRLARKFTYARFTILKDLPALGRPRPDGKLGQRAVVCGGR